MKPIRFQNKEKTIKKDCPKCGKINSLIVIYKDDIKNFVATQINRCENCTYKEVIINN